MKCLSLWELCEGNLEGGLLYWGPIRIYERRHWRLVPLSIRAPLGNLEGRFVYGGLRETVKEGSGNKASLCMGAL
jgi:hypothetical protein